MWLNTCIGRGNYRSFFIFISTIPFLCAFTLALVVSRFIIGSRINSTLIGSEISQNPPAIFLGVYSLIAGTGVGYLMGYHWWLAARNFTTHEHVSCGCG
jgi:palmitoyltransferase ZDHHC9/14/18